ncbi:hypothetical protein EVAR_35949_1 [Eumeta japonica]|uniref:Uncharacterized protein n=1 Tax=Eumeta variegata TaxID=151549 RepID=A0A4C1W3P9_EUMVA|nr:hypothetical protein EVAR_35949_1 [Eumeta japonica]
MVGSYYNRNQEEWTLFAYSKGEIKKTLKRCCSSGFHARWNSSTKNSTDLRLGVRALLIIVRLIVDKKTVQRRWFPRTVELFDKEQLETWRRALLIIVRLIVDKKTVQRRWFPRTVELFDKEQHKLETWRTGAANHRSTDRGQENSAAALVSAHVQRRWFPRWNSSTNNGTDLRLGVRALLIIVRLIVDKKTVQRRWFPRTVELFDEERHRLETWRTGAANHRSTDRGQENSAAALVSAHGGTLRQRTAQT